MNIAKISGVILLTFIIAGCDKILPDPTIDTTSDESMKQSSQKVRESLPEGNRVEFDQALQLLAFSQIDMKTLFAERAAGAGNIESKIKTVIVYELNGKTYKLNS